RQAFDDRLQRGYHGPHGRFSLPTVSATVTVGVSSRFFISLSSSLSCSNVHLTLRKFRSALGLNSTRRRVLLRPRCLWGRPRAGGVREGLPAPLQQPEPLAVLKQQGLSDFAPRAPGPLQLLDPRGQQGNGRVQLLDRLDRKRVGVLAGQ